MKKWEELKWFVESHIETCKSEIEMYRKNPDIWIGSEDLIWATRRKQNAYELVLDKIERLEGSDEEME